MAEKKSLFSFFKLKLKANQKYWSSNRTSLDFTEQVKIYLSDTFKVSQKQGKIKRSFYWQLWQTVTILNTMLNILIRFRGMHKIIRMKWNYLWKVIPFSLRAFPKRTFAIVKSAQRKNGNINNNWPVSLWYINSNATLATKWHFLRRRLWLPARESQRLPCSY